MTAELLEEAIRMRRVPGIAFVDGPAGRRAVVGGSGLDVWEVIATWKQCGGRLDLLRQSYPWLTEAQIRAALSYYEVYPNEIEARLKREEQWTPEQVWCEQPFSRPPRAELRDLEIVFSSRRRRDRPPPPGVGGAEPS